MNEKVKGIFIQLFWDRTTTGDIFPGSNYEDFPKARWQKTKEEQQLRTKQFAEVLTPVNIVQKMVDMLEQEAGLEDNPCLNFEKTLLDPAVGEGIFITTRHDPITGKFIPPGERTGVLDRRLQSINGCCDITNWWHGAEDAMKTLYGCDINRDSLTICRNEILLSIFEHSCRWYKEDFNEEITWGAWEKLGCPFDYYMENMAEIISWNFPRMDFLTGCVPEYDTPVLFKDWEKGVMPNDGKTKDLNQ